MGKYILQAKQTKDRIGYFVQLERVGYEKLAGIHIPNDNPIILETVRAIENLINLLEDANHDRTN